jgi:alpha-tubulin suppressor-like RCC1 family protein
LRPLFFLLFVPGCELSLAGTGAPRELDAGEDRPPGSETIDAGREASPPGPLLLDGATKIRAGQAHTCAIVGARVACWGAGTDGQLGDGRGVSSPRAVWVKGIGDAIDLALGARYSCARTATGHVLCWGRGRLEPQILADGASALAAGSDHACVLVKHEVRCWGKNDRGQLGLGTTDDADAPTPVPGLEAVEIAAGGSHTCARRMRGRVECWGDNVKGQLGVSTDERPIAMWPVEARVDPVDGLVLGSGTSCAVRGNETFCWGDNGAGQLGDPNDVRPFSHQPVKVQARGEIAVGAAHACAREAVVSCWGSNALGQLGVQGGDRRAPVSTGIAASALALGGRHACAVVGGGRVVCWGDGTDGQLGNGLQASGPARVEVLAP